MTSFRNLFIAVIIGLAGSLFISPALAGAITASECYKQYDGKIFQDNNSSDSSSEYDKFMKQRDDACFDRKDGNCTISISEETARTTTYRVNCTKKSGTNQDAFNAPAGDQGTEDQYVDPAFSAAASCSKSSCGVIANYVNPAIKLLSILVGIAVVIGIIVGAIQVITSAGDPQRSASGKNHIRNALIALVAYAFVFALLNWLLPGGVV